MESFFYFCSLNLIFLAIVSGVQCQSFAVPPASETCPGQRVSFTCVTNLGVTNWPITPPGDDGVCSYSGLAPDIDFCGPGDRFTSSPIDDGDARSSSLSVVLADDINGTMVQCQEAIINGTIIGSSSICVSDIVESPTFNDNVMRSGDEWVVSWSEVLDSCSNNPVSQYMFCVTPLTTSGDGSGQGIPLSYYNVSSTLFSLAINASVNLTVSGITCDNITGPSSEPLTIIFIDQTNVTTVTPEHNDGGILENITVALDGVFLEFNGLRVAVDVTITLSAQKTLPPDANVDDIVVVTSELSVTISVPPNVIAEYRLTLTVPGTQSIDLTPDLIPSEQNATELDEELVSVDINGSCSSIVTCLAIPSLYKCTVYCGPGPDLSNLTMRNESTSVSNDGDIDVRLPPTFDKEFHCIVSGSNSDGSLLFRVRTLDFKTGCPVDELLSTEEDPVCVEEEDGNCFCTLNSTDGRYGVMYSSTSVGSIANLFTSSDYCYDGSQTEMITTCGINVSNNQQWSGNIEEQLIVEAKLETTPNSVIVALIAVGLISLVIGVFGAVMVVVSVVKTPPSSIPIWYWVLFGAASVVTVAAIIMWIVVAVYLPSHGGVNDESGKIRDPVTSLCEDVTNDDTRVTLVIICFILSVFVPILWFICLILNCLRIGVKSSDPKDQERRQERLETTNIPQPYEEPLVVKSIQLTSNEAYGPIRNDSGINTTQNVSYGQVQSSSSSSAPPTNYEEVREIDRTQDIQLASNEAYGPVQRSNVQTSPNMAYGQVNL